MMAVYASKGAANSKALVAPKTFHENLVHVLGCRVRVSIHPAVLRRENHTGFSNGQEFAMHSQLYSPSSACGLRRTSVHFVTKDPS